MTRAIRRFVTKLGNFLSQQRHRLAELCLPDSDTSLRVHQRIAPVRPHAKGRRIAAVGRSRQER